MQGYISSVTYCCVSLPSKHSSWWRRLEDVLETYFVAVFKTSSRRLDQDEYIRLSHTSSGDVFKTSWSRWISLPWSYIFKTSSKRLQDVLQKRCVPAQMCFLVAVAIFLRTPILKNISERLLLKVSTSVTKLPKGGNFWILLSFKFCYDGWRNGFVMLCINMLCQGFSVTVIS